MRNLLRLTSGEFENELAERVPHNRENGPKLITGVHVFLGFTKITLNIPLPEETVGEFIVFARFTTVIVGEIPCWPPFEVKGQIPRF